ncbi:MAG: LysO family transporter [Salinivirgaceae bacterium]
MIGVLIVMTLGIVIGLAFRSKTKMIQLINKSTIWIIFLLLFFMGISIGANPIIMKNIDTIGIRGFELALVSVLGSSLLSWLVYHLFFKKEQNEG